MLLSTGLAAPLPVRAAIAPAAEPDPKIERAKELLENGARLYNEGSYEAAILAFQEGYELTEEPAFLYNIGNCYERLGNFAAARDHLDRYRAFAPENERDVLARRITALDERVRKQREEEAAAAANQNNNTPTPEPEPEPEPEPADDDKADRLYGPAAIALTGVAAVGLGLGIGFGVKANNERKTALENCVESGNDYLCSVNANDALKSRRTSALIADIGFVIGGAAAVGVITAIAVKAAQRKGKTDETARRRQLTPWASKSGAGLVWTARF
ncbi:MAG: hypothetical protein KC420_06005 [Myxococcales bacterium]|nr:hypothetical protein [Myxococcales bacterium]MCB9700388.1 hypothetical protein [Myxococcales bacterium]